MPHIRTQIRSQITNLLRDSTAAADRVYPFKPIDNPEDNLPAIYVAVLTETSQRSGRCQGLDRRPELEIYAFVKAGDTTSVDDVADALALEIEQQIEGGEAQLSSILDMVLTQTEIQIDEATKDLAQLRMTYEVEAISMLLLDM